MITDIHLLVRMSWRKGEGGEESERLQCWSHVIAVAEERSLEESWLGANTAEKGDRENEREREGMK